MKIQIIEKECVARTGISIEFSNSEQSAIQTVGNKLTDAIDKATEEATKFTEASQLDTKLDAAHVTVKIDLETAMRIQWLLGNFVHKSDSGLFNTADNACIETMARINHEDNELSPTTK